MASPASARFLAERGDGGSDELPVIIASAAVCGVVFALVFIYIFGCAPRVVLQAESRVIRSCKKRKRWSWDHIEQHLILGALPRWPCHLEELKANGVGAVLSLNEQWEMAMSPTCIQADCGMERRTSFRHGRRILWKPLRSLANTSMPGLVCTCTAMLARDEAPAV